MNALVFIFLRTTKNTAAGWRPNELLVVRLESWTETQPIAGRNNARCLAETAARHAAEKKR